MLGTATVMMGAPADLLSFRPETHSLGLVKNFAVTQDPSYTELTQGVKNTVVDSALTSNKTSCTFEVYEATAKNIAYGLGLDGSILAAAAAIHTPTANIVPAATTATIATDLTAVYAAGDWIQLKQGDDTVHVAKLSAVAYSAPNTTLTFAGYAVPTGLTFVAAATSIAKVKAIPVGSAKEQPYLAAKVVGKLSNNETITLLIPKLRISKGFSLSFNTNDYGNLPFEFTPYAPTPADPLYSKFDNPESPIQILLPN